jgi:putative chitobiose transport system substrate-binding protein
VVSQGQRRAIELFQSGDVAMAATGAEFLRSIQTNAPGVAAVTESHPPVTGADGTANVALMTLAVPRQSTKQALALQLALLLTDATNQARFATEARVLPSSVEALAMVRSQLQNEQTGTPQQDQIREARLLSATTLERARVLVPALPGIKRLQKNSLHPVATSHAGPGGQRRGIRGCGLGMGSLCSVALAAQWAQFLRQSVNRLRYRPFSRVPIP